MSTMNSQSPGLSSQSNESDQHAFDIFEDPPRPGTPPNSLYGSPRCTTPFDGQRFDLTARRDLSTPRTTRDNTVSDPFRSPIIEADSDEDEDSIFGGSLEDALAAIALVTNNNHDDFSDSDDEVVVPSPTLYDSTPAQSSEGSLRVLLDEHEDDEDEEVFIENTDSEVSDNVEDINVVDHGTHIVTRTLIRPFKLPKRNPLGLLTSLVNPQPLWTHTRTASTTSGSSYSNSITDIDSDTCSAITPPPSRPSSPFSFLNHRGSFSRPSAPIPESMHIIPFTLTNPLFEEDVDYREDLWAKEKMGDRNIEVSIRVEREVKIEYYSESSGSPSEEEVTFGIVSRGTMTPDSKKGLGVLVYSAEGRGLLGPKDQPRRRVFTPVKRA